MTMTTEGGANQIPVSCSLPTNEQPLRIAEFDRLFAESVLRFRRTDATKLDLVLSAEAEGAARDLATRETACCSFFGFQFASAGPRVVMSITVPESHTDVLDALTERVADRPWSGVPSCCSSARVSAAGPDRRMAKPK